MAVVVAHVGAPLLVRRKSSSHAISQPATVAPQQLGTRRRLQPTTCVLECATRRAATLEDRVELEEWGRFTRISKVERDDPRHSSIRRETERALMEALLATIRREAQEQEQLEAAQEAEQELPSHSHRQLEELQVVGSGSARLRRRTPIALAPSTEQLHNERLEHRTLGSEWSDQQRLLAGKVTRKLTPMLKEKRKAHRAATAGPQSVRQYLMDMACAPLLTHEEELEYGRQLKEMTRLKSVKAKLEKQLGHSPSDYEWAEAAGVSGSAELEEIIRAGRMARHQLVVSNLRLVVSVAKRYQNRGLPLIDMCQEGMLGLVKGADRFDYKKGFKFSTYAYWWIRQAITRGIANDSRMIRLPIRTVETLYQIKRTAKLITDQSHREPRTTVLAEACGLPREKVEAILRGAAPVASLDCAASPNSKTQDMRSIMDCLPDGRPGPDDVAESHMMKDDLRNALNLLRPREREVIRLRYGLGEEERVWTLEEVGQIFSVTRERIRQIECEALNKLRCNIRAGNLREYLC
eukprot:jgi/Chlat1/239/Chrsp1S03148